MMNLVESEQENNEREHKIIIVVLMSREVSFKIIINQEFKMTYPKKINLFALFLKGEN
jgi:hypothetical protein